MAIKQKIHLVIIWLPALLMVSIGIPMVLSMAEESLYEEIESEDMTRQNKAFYKLRDIKNHRADTSLLKLLKTLSMQASYINDKYNSRELVGFRNAVVEELSRRGMHEEIEPLVAFISDANHPSTRNKALFKLIQNYSDDNELINAIASGDYVDIDIYHQLIKFVPDKSRSLLFEKIIDNNKLLDEDVLNLLLSRKDVKEILAPHVYEKLLVITEVPLVDILGYGISDTKEDRKQGFITWYIEKQTTKIPNKPGVKFGMIYKVSKKLSDTPIKLNYETIYPQGSTSDSLIMLPDIEDGVVENGGTHIYYEEFDDTWKFKSGKWELQIKYKGQIVAKKVFYVEPHK